MQPKIRDIFATPIVGHIDQGYIFSGAKSDLYPQKNVQGLIITPRCDIAQRKVDEIYYLPVIKFDDWKELEFPTIYCSRLYSDILSWLDDKFVKLNVSPSIITKFTTDDIKDILNAIRIAGKEQKAICLKLETLLQISEYRKTHDSNVLNTLLSNNQGPRKTIMKEILSNKLPNYYVLDSKESYYVVRLRELKRLQATLFYRIGNGIVANDLNKQDFLYNDIVINDPDEDMIYPLAVLKSPFIEHLMQCFTQWFSRIGVEDLDNHTCEYLINNWR